MKNIFIGLLLPLVGTTLGSACVFFMKNKMSGFIEKLLCGFAGGVMVAASVWSLLIPAMDKSSHLGKFAFLPAVIGFLLGIFFLLILDKLVPHLHSEGSECEGIKCNLGKSTMLFFSVALHNLPEGMAIGVVYAALLSGDSNITMASALALSLGIAIQNFPEGAIISMPLKSTGNSKGKSFFLGFLSGVIEPLGAIITILAAPLIIPILPYLLAFAAGAMIYVVVEELIPEMSLGSHSNVGTIAFSIGFVIMMALDVALG